MHRLARVVSCGLLACQPKPEPGGGDPPSGGMSLESEAFAAGAEIPSEYTCEGRDVSPPLRWSGVPAAARSLALVETDPDAPDPAAPKTIYTHWILVDLPPADGSLPAGVTPERLPAGAREGTNDWGRVGYGGPCPPIGRHRYFHTLYALDTTLPSLQAPTRAELEQAMAGHVLAKAALMGTYQKQKAP
ncbi:phospholipid-binding protein, PBP family [Nannocystis exedens]|uniref:Phospholipid-binding protein, PBP family n=2 Tax=Nannocystis exedens TaxID=54 RepID=A0A1I1T710_9BACT|nr:YbhB/YbcL family Raf kinase inhibitor-like protein [Nannocystis exedens]PCC66741.1 phosphatidylethanolamine-binding protein [Nannocystis exedens]SFD54409.1 phospholipid-binding protein, PBP family [Nannocystis exedens]